MNDKAKGACVNSAFGRQGYRNRRAVSHIYAPTAATGGFPYNRKSVAECDPLPGRHLSYAKKYQPKEYGYDA